MDPIVELLDQRNDEPGKLRITFGRIMTSSLPELTDLSNEPESIWEIYGPKAKEPRSYAYNCLMARRMAERGVRFTQIFHRGWDAHYSLPHRMKILCEDIGGVSFFDNECGPRRTRRGSS